MASYDGNNTQEADDSRKRRNNVLIILLALLLLGSIGYNIYQYMQAQQKIANLEKRNIDSENLRQLIRNQLDSARAQLEEYRGRNARLDSTIAQRERDLVEKANRINQLLKENKISYNKYITVKDEVEKWKYYSDKYLAEVNRLNEENKKLTAQNETLQENVKGQKKEIDKLTDEVVSKTNKLAVASRLMLDPADIQITGVHMRKGNKERETSRAKQIEKLKICFTIHKNLAAYSGKKDIYLQVLDPKGQTVAIQSLGSGTIKVEGADAQYSTKDEVDYNNEQDQNHCMYWGGADAKFEEGRYKLNLYTDGYLMGSKEYIIK